MSAEMERVMYLRNKGFKRSELVPKLLNIMGIDNHLIGYYYLKDAIFHIINTTSTGSYAFYDGIYWYVATLYNTTAANVKYQMQYAVDNAFIGKVVPTDIFPVYGNLSTHQFIEGFLKTLEKSC